MKQNQFGISASIILAGLATLVLAGCGSAADSAAPDQPDAGSTVDAPESNNSSTDPSGADGTAVLTIGDTTYTAQLESCMLYMGEEALFHGPATDDSGATIGYLSGDFVGLTSDPYGEVRVSFGATGNLESSDEFVAFGNVMGHITITDSSEESLIVMGNAWDQNGAELPTGTLKVEC